MSVESEELAERIRGLIGHKPGVIEKRMFGGFGFMLNGNMVAGSMSTGEILLRADPKRIDEALAIPGAAPMKMGERVMTGFYTVDYDAIANDDDLKTWIDRSWAYVKTMPPKAEKQAAKKAAAKKAKRRPRRHRQEGRCEEGPLDRREHQRRVHAAEAEGVGEHMLQRLRLRHVRHEVELLGDLLRIDRG